MGIPFFGELDKQDIDYGIFLAIGGILMILYVFSIFDVSQTRVVSVTLATAPVWLPIASFLLMFSKWMQMVGMWFTIKGGRTILEIVLPPEVMKSPEAMEFFFNQVFASGAADNLWQVYIDGKRPPMMTCEIQSRSGAIHFYITVPDKLVQNIKDNLYAQYPGVSVVETEMDYTAEVPSDLPEGWGFLSFHMSKKKEEFKPLKTYIDFGLDKMPKEEEKVDPITPLLEVMSSIKPGEQLWVQFLMKAHREEDIRTGSLKKVVEWREAAGAHIDELMQRDSKTKKGAVDEEGNPRLTPGERSSIEAIERNVSKSAYNVAIRWCYVCSPEASFNPDHIGKMLRALAQTEVKGGNGLGMRWRTDFNYKWFSDPFGTKLPKLFKEELGEYKRRILFTKGGGMDFVAFSVEEMATLFHLPGQVAMTPTLNRVTSTRSEAPSNLPVGNLPQ